MILKKEKILFTAVFITGAAVLIIEVTATRILAPYFGNTLFSVSSIIGVVLGALSLGYYIGGNLAEKKPNLALFFFLIFLAGIFSFLIYGLSRTLLVFLGYTLDIKTGPVVLSLLLFFAPSLILGTISPLAIKILSLEDKHTGRISGKVFFWSTLGSIFGSFFSGFFLIPRFGVSAIIISNSLVLILTGLAGFLTARKNSDPNFLKSVRLWLFLLFVFCLSFFSFENSGQGKAIFKKDGLYSQIIVEEREYKGRRARLLRLDRGYEGGMYIDDAEQPFEYIKHYTVYKLAFPNPKRALFLGGGAYSAPRDILENQESLERVDVAEIEPALYELAKEYFRLKDDQRLKNYIIDGRRFLKESETKYDLIFSDAYDSLYLIPVHFTTKEFFSLAKQRLSENGAMVVNVIGNLKETEGNLLFSEIKTFRSVFENSYFFAMEGKDQERNQNFIFFGVNGEKIISLGSDILVKTGDEILRDLPEKLLNIDSLKLEAAPLLTDDFSPVEYLVSKIF